MGKREAATFSVRINDGPEQRVRINSGLYHQAAQVAIMTLAYTPSGGPEEKIEIWCPDLIPKYGPYTFHWNHEHQEIRHYSKPVKIDDTIYRFYS